MAPQKYVTRDELMFLLNQRIPGARAAPYPVDLSDPGQVSSDLPLANLQGASATKRLLARVSSGAGDWEEATLSDVLDFITGAAQGDVLYRGASAWARLAADTDGKVLTTHGAGADPTWETASGGGAWTLLESHTASASASLPFTTRNAAGQSGATFQADCDEYVIELQNLVPSGDASLLWRVSTDGGSTYDTSNQYYHQHYVWRAGGSALDGTIPDSAGFLHYYGTAVESTGNGINGTLRLYDPLGAGSKRMFGTLQYLDSGAFRVVSHGDVGWEAATAVNAFELYYNGVGITIASGVARLYGLQK